MPEDDVKKLESMQWSKTEELKKKHGEPWRADEPTVKGLAYNQLRRGMTVRVHDVLTGDWTTKVARLYRDSSGIDRVVLEVKSGRPLDLAASELGMKQTRNGHWYHWRRLERG